MSIIGFLVLFPLLAAFALLCIRNNRVRNVIVWTSATAIGIGSIVLAVIYFTQGEYFEFSSPVIDTLCSVVGIVIAVCILAYAIKYKNLLAAVLGIIQVALALIFEFGFAHDLHVTHGLYLDPLTILMALIIGIIGSGICVYALGYMEDFQDQHRGAKDRRPVFFALMLLFLSAMFGVVVSDNLLWLFTAWEVTTICSFLLIGYTKTEEAIKNAFKQIMMNLLGGISFSVALISIAINFETLSFSQFLNLALIFPDLATLPVICLAFAGITKAAQMPFQSWLLGAMVAPTPTSALLHSSTMVKAGVFLLIKLAPIFAVSALPSLMVILVGGVTFAFCSFIAISQSNAKRVLAYSTVANLGLIVACAGVGTPGAIWAAIFLVIFHAIAKSLLFLCVGTAEHHIGSRDIEDMDLLFERTPRLARYMMLGIMCMFIAPFGMLIAKWATLISFIDARQVALIILLAFGSGATFMFWAKWFGKLAGIAGKPANMEKWTHKSEWIPMGVMVALVILCCAGLPFISAYSIEPYLLSIFGMHPIPGYTISGISDTNLWIASFAMLFVVGVLFFGLGKSKARKVDVYLSGVSANNSERTFTNSLSQPTKATSRNWYMEKIFGESVVGPVGTICCTIVICGTFIAALLLPGIL